LTSSTAFQCFFSLWGWRRRRKEEEEERETENREEERRREELAVTCDHKTMRQLAGK